MIRFSENSTISRVSGPFPRKYLSHLSPFPKCPNLWLRYFSGGKARCNLDSSIIDHVRYLNILTWPRGFCSLIPKSDLDTKTPPPNIEVRLKASGDVRRLIPVERGLLSIIMTFRLFVQVVGNNSKLIWSFMSTSQGIKLDYFRRIRSSRRQLWTGIR